MMYNVGPPSYNVGVLPHLTMVITTIIQLILGYGYHDYGNPQS